VLFKSFIDKDPSVARKFDSIVQSAQVLETALAERNWTRAREAIEQEWTARKTLASGISTPEMDQALQAAQLEAPIGFKVCGAGGGGCFFIFLESDDASLRKRVTERVLQSSPGIRALPFKISLKGLEVK
jgi:D-glycero-alpha-D-manno-heptose-7-phosphate kinase